MNEIVHVRQDANHMATTFELVISCERGDAPRADRALSRAHDQLRGFEREWSEFLEDSVLSSWNRHPGHEPIALSDEQAEICSELFRLHEITQGAFDPSFRSVRANGDSAKLGLSSGWRFDSETQQLIKLSVGAHLSLGAYGKGKALDQIRLLLEREGFRDYLLSAGGSSLVVSGFAAPGEPWPLAWGLEKSADQSWSGITLSHVSGDAVAIGVSGLQEQAAHIQDTRNPNATPTLLSAWVAHPSAAYADALSTALFLGATPSLPQTAWATVDRKRVPEWNGLFARLWPGLGAVASLGGWALISSAQADESASEAADAAQEEVVDLGEESVDLGSEADATGVGKTLKDSWNPYLFDRSPVWVIPAVFALGMVLLHLMKIKNQKRSPKLQKRGITP